MTDGNSAANTLKPIFILCLVVSVGLHLVSVLFLAYIWTAPAAVNTASYLEMRDLVSTPADSPTAIMSQPASDSPAPGQRQPPSEPAQERQPETAISDNEAAPTPDIGATPLGLGMSHGFVSSLGDGVTLRADIRDYYLLLVERINKQWWEKAGTLKEAIRQDGSAVLVILRDGTLVDRRINRGTGSVEADRALLESIDKSAPMPPLPESYERDVFTAPLKISAPLQLFRSAR